MISPAQDIVVESHDEANQQEITEIPKERLKLGLSQLRSTPDGQHYAFSELNLMVWAQKNAPCNLIM